VGTVERDLLLQASPMAFGYFGRFGWGSRPIFPARTIPRLSSAAPTFLGGWLTILKGPTRVGSGATIELGVGGRRVTLWQTLEKVPGARGQWRAKTPWMDLGGQVGDRGTTAVISDWLLEHGFSF